MTYVDKFHERRYQRLKSRGLVERNAIEEFRKRRDARLDADNEEEGGNNKPKNRVNHGNTRLPFGLCQREGISIESGWTPTDAWEALEGKGYNAKEEYAGLREGKPSGSSKKESEKPKGKRKELKTESFPDEMTKKSHIKSTQEYVDLINKNCKDDNILNIVSGIGKMTKKGIKVRMLSTIEGCAVQPYIDGSVKIAIPNISKLKTPEQKNVAVNTFIHEFTHFIDKVLSKDGVFGQISYENTNYLDALKKEEDNGIGEKAKKLFEEYNKLYDNNIKKLAVDIDKINDDIIDEIFDGRRPDFIDRNGDIDWFETKTPEDFKNCCQYEKEQEKRRKEFYDKSEIESRSLLDGVFALEGLYSDMSKGKLNKSGMLKFGHSEVYARSTRNQTAEVFAGYMSLKATNPELANIFAEDHPETAKELDKMIEEIGNKYKGD